MTGKINACRTVVLILTVMIALAGTWLFAAESAPDAPISPYRVFRLKNISAQQGKDYLKQLNIGTVSMLPNPGTLLVTAPPKQLLKIASVLKIVDSKEKFVIKQILPASEAATMPAKDELAAELGDILIGSFVEPPLTTGRPGAIIDVHDDAVLAVAPAAKFDKIVSAVKKLQKPTAAPAAPVEIKLAVAPEPNKAEISDADMERIAALAALARQVEADANTPAKSGLFNGLLKTLDQAQNKTTTQITEPNTAQLIPAPEIKLPDNIRQVPQTQQIETDAPAPGNSELFARALDSLEKLEAKTAEQTPEPNEQPQQPTQAVVPTEPEEKQIREPAQTVPPTEPEQPLEIPQTTPPAEPSEGIDTTAAQADQSTQNALLAAILQRLQSVESKLQQQEQQPALIAQTPEQTPAPQPLSAQEREIIPPIPPEHKWKFRSYDPNDLPDPDAVLEFNLPPKLPLVDFVNFIGETLGLDPMYDPLKLKGEVTLTISGGLKGPMTVREFYERAQNILQFHGFVMIRRGKLLTVVPKGEALLYDPKIVDDDTGNIGYGHLTVTRIFKLDHIDPVHAKTLLDSLSLGIDIKPITDTGTLIVIGYSHRMARIERFLQMVDKPGKPKKFRYRQLRYTMAPTLAPKIKELAEQLGSISINIGLPAATKSTPTSKRPSRRSKGRPTPPSRKPKSIPPTTQAPKPTVYLDADERTNRILMIGLEDQLTLVEDLIDSLDVEQQDLRTMRAYEIQYVGAEEVKAKLEELNVIGASKSSSSSKRPTSGRPSRPGTPTTGAKGRIGSTPSTVGSAEEPLGEEPQVVIIDATNSLLVNATAEQHIRVATIIAYVDAEAQETAKPYVLYSLENQEPESLATLLNQLVKDTITQEDKAGKIISKESKSKTEEQITIISDENTFSIIVYASRKNQVWIGDLIKTLDKRRPQVLIDVTLVQITKDDIFNFDLDLLSAIPDASLVSGQTPVTSVIYDLLTGPDSDRKRFMEFSSSFGQFTGFYGDRKINALLTAMQSKGYGRVMARPKLLVNDAELGTIKTIDTTYVKRTSSNIIGTDNPTTSTQTEFDDYSAGITLTITPHISEGNMLRLEITLNRSGFTSALGGENPPDTADTDVSTIVTVPDKSTIILGGMEKIQQGKETEKIPILGDLPFIGPAFRSVVKSSVQDKTYIFVKAHILRPGTDASLEDLKLISQYNRDKFEKLEAEMQAYAIWPGLKEEPMDPLRILEED